MRSSFNHQIIALTIFVMTTMVVACTGSSATPASTPMQPTATILQTLTLTAPPVNIGFQGTVLDTQTGKKIAGVYINFKNSDGSVQKDTLSDTNGSFQIDLPKGSYTVNASLQGYQTYSSGNPIELSTSGYTATNISLIPNGAATETVPAQLSISGNCEGAQFGGLCWYFGDENLSCEAVCSAHGGYNEGTKDFTGSSGSSTNCINLFAEMGIVVVENSNQPENNFISVLESKYGGLGCFGIFNQSENAYQIYRDGDATTAQAILNKPGARRMCSCQK